MEEMENSERKNRWPELVFSESELGLLTPVKPQRPSKDDHVREQMGHLLVVLPYSDITGEKLTLKEIYSEVKQLDRKSMLRLLSLVSTLLVNEGQTDVDLQRKLMGMLLPRTYWPKILAIMKQNDSQRILFSEHQLLYCFSLFLRLGRASPPPREDRQTFLEVLSYSLFKILLGINDYLHTGPTSSDLSDSELEESILRSQILNLREDDLLLIARYYELLFKLPYSDRSRNHPSRLDVGEIFEQATGLSMLDYFASGFGTFSRFVKLNTTNLQAALNQYWLDPYSYFHTTRLASRGAKNPIRQLISSQTALKMALRKEVGRTQQPYYSFTPFKQRPLIRMSRNQVIPISVRYLIENITTGIYWRILDYLSPAGGTGSQRKTGERFMTFFGDLFEQYVQNVFKRMFPASKASPDRVTYEFSYGEHDDRTTDAILVYPDTLVLIESKSSRLTRDTGITGAVARIEADLEKYVYKAAGQMDRVIQDFRLRKFTIKGVDPSQVRRFIPVVVTLVPVPINIFTRKRIDDYLMKTAWLEKPGVTQLVVLSAEELEMLEVVVSKGISILEVLTEYLNSKAGVGIPMKTFLFNQYSHLSPFRNEFLLSKYNELMTHVQKTLFD